MNAGLKRYWMLAEPVVAVKLRSNALVVRNRQPVWVGGAPLNGQILTGGVAGSAALAPARR